MIEMATTIAHKSSIMISPWMILSTSTTLKVWLKWLSHAAVRLSALYFWLIIALELLITWWFRYRCTSQWLYITLRSPLGPFIALFTTLLQSGILVHWSNILSLTILFSAWFLFSFSTCYIDITNLNMSISQSKISVLHSNTKLS